MRGRNETEDTANSGIFRRLVDFVVFLDTSGKHHLDYWKVFKGMSITSSVVSKYVRNDVDMKHCFSIPVVESTDIWCDTQMDIILRYQIDVKFMTAHLSWVS